MSLWPRWSVRKMGSGWKAKGNAKPAGARSLFGGQGEAPGSRQGRGSKS